MMQQALTSHYEFCYYYHYHYWEAARAADEGKKKEIGATFSQ